MAPVKGASAAAPPKKQPRRKLKSEEFEWTDDAIMKFENAAEEESKGNNASKDNEEDGVPVVSAEPEDMDVKIARVQRRKRAEEDRIRRQELLPKPPAKMDSNLDQFVPVSGDDSNAEKLAAALNTFFDNYLERNGAAALVESSVARYPFYFFDDSKFDENYKVTTEMLPLEYSACLIPKTPDTDPEMDISGGNALGEWSPCVIHDIITVNKGQDNERLAYDVEMLGEYKDIANES